MLKLSLGLIDDEDQKTDDEEGRDSVLIIIKEIKVDIKEIRKNMNND